MILTVALRKVSHASQIFSHIKRVAKQQIMIKIMIYLHFNKAFDRVPLVTLEEAKSPEVRQ